ncbi:MAG: sigma-70 family RNA polymerase sigma factor [Myxococcota bacterium]
MTHLLASGSGDGGLNRDLAQEAQWTARLRRGDEGAYVELVRRYGPFLFATARTFVANDFDARDILQDTLTKAYCRIDDFRGHGSLKGWLRRILINTALLRLRQRREEVPLEAFLPYLDASGVLAEGSSHLPGDAEGVVGQKEVQRCVRAAIARLPDTYRAIVLLRDIYEYSTVEAAGMLRITPAAAKVRLHRARSALRVLVEQRFSEPDWRH